jgi:hypothetical protein
MQTKGAFLPSYPEDGSTNRNYRSPNEPVGISYLLEFEIQIGLPREFFTLDQPEQMEVLKKCKALLCDNAPPPSQYDQLTAKWKRGVSDFQATSVGEPVSLQQLHGVLSMFVDEYSTKIWSKKGGKSATRVLPLSLEEMDNPLFHGVQYIWSEGRFICIHSLALKHQEANGPINPWSFEILLENGKKISTVNVGQIRWQVAGG